MPCRTPVGIYETALFPVTPFPAQSLTVPQDSWFVIANRGVTTPGAVIRGVELNSPTAATLMRVTISAADIVEQVCSGEVFIVITGTIVGQPRTVLATSGQVAIVNGFYTVVDIALTGAVNFTNPGTGTVAHVSVRFQPVQQFVGV